VRIVDQFGNLTASTAAVTVAIGTNPGGGTLSGTATQSAVAGVATFSGLSNQQVRHRLHPDRSHRQPDRGHQQHLHHQRRSHQADLDTEHQHRVFSPERNDFRPQLPGLWGQWSSTPLQRQPHRRQRQPGHQHHRHGHQRLCHRIGSTLTGATGGTLTVTIPVGSSTSGQVDFSSQTGSWTSNTITKSTGYTDGTATFNK
jgi:hypothetical protein